MNNLLYGTRVKLLDQGGDTGLRGYVVGDLRPARDENGATIMVYVVEPGETALGMGEHPLYAKWLEESPFESVIRDAVNLAAVLGINAPR